MAVAETATTEGPLTWQTSGLAEAILGLDGFQVLAVDESAAEVVITVETNAVVVGCGICGVLAEAHDRMQVHAQDSVLRSSCSARLAEAPVAEQECPKKTWTEQVEEAVPARSVLTVRAGTEATRRVGELAARRCGRFGVRCLLVLEQSASPRRATSR